MLPPNDTSRQAALTELQRLGQEFDAPADCKACSQAIHECACPDVVAAGVVPGEG